mmetsp:Transcript_26245/g.66810  ORF Transcript_26245/g.66810 Transcript_26245/m.66810 type:complete len:569 (-) Transcript_26245:1124-2830(-)
MSPWSQAHIRSCTILQHLYISVDCLCRSAPSCIPCCDCLRAWRLQGICCWCSISRSCVRPLLPALPLLLLLALSQVRKQSRRCALIDVSDTCCKHVVHRAHAVRRRQLELEDARPPVTANVTPDVTSDGHGEPGQRIQPTVLLLLAHPLPALLAVLQRLRQVVAHVLALERVRRGQQQAQHLLVHLRVAVHRAHQDLVHRQPPQRAAHRQLPRLDQVRQPLGQRACEVKALEHRLAAQRGGQQLAGASHRQKVAPQQPFQHERLRQLARHLAALDHVHGGVHRLLGQPPPAGQLLPRHVGGRGRPVPLKVQHPRGQQRQQVVQDARVRLRQPVLAVAQHLPPVCRQLHDARHKCHLGGVARQLAVHRRCVHQLHDGGGQQVQGGGVAQHHARLAQHPVRLHQRARHVARALRLVLHVPLALARLAARHLPARLPVLRTHHVGEVLLQLLQVLVRQQAIGDARVNGPRQLMAPVLGRHRAVVVVQRHEQLRAQRAVAQLLVAHVQRVAVAELDHAQLHHLVVDLLRAAHHALEHLHDVAALAQDLARHRARRGAQHAARRAALQGRAAA